MTTARGDTMEEERIEAGAPRTDARGTATVQVVGLRAGGLAKEEKEVNDRQRRQAERERRRNPGGMRLTEAADAGTAAATVRRTTGRGRREGEGRERGRRREIGREEKKKNVQTNKATEIERKEGRNK